MIRLWLSLVLAYSFSLALTKEENQAAMKEARTIFMDAAKVKGGFYKCVKERTYGWESCIPETYDGYTYLEIKDRDKLLAKLKEDIERDLLLAGYK